MYSQLDHDVNTASSSSQANTITLGPMLFFTGTYITFGPMLLFAGTYIPPGPMLNSASTRLACLEDVEIDVGPPDGPRRLFRRRVFAPEDKRDERYLTASDVVKVTLCLFPLLLHHCLLLLQQLTLSHIRTTLFCHLAWPSTCIDCGL